MDKKEYVQKLADMAEKYKQDVWFLKKEYAISNSPVSNGDIITDHIGSIKVDVIQVGQDFYGVPECIYSGTCHTKAGKPFKTRERREVYQSNLKTTDR